MPEDQDSEQSEAMPNRASAYVPIVETSAMPDNPLTKRQKLARDFDTLRKAFIINIVLWFTFLMIGIFTIASKIQPIYYPVMLPEYDMYNFMLEAGMLGTAVSICGSVTLNIASLILAKSFTIPQYKGKTTIVHDTSIIFICLVLLSLVFFWGRA